MANGREISNDNNIYIYNMITTTKNLQEKIDQFNSDKKYICTCSHCNSNIIYTNDECKEKINIARKHDYTIKCPYCGHMVPIEKYFEVAYEYKLVTKEIMSFMDEEFNV